MPLEFANRVLQRCGDQPLASVPGTPAYSSLRPSTVALRSVTNRVFCRDRTNVHSIFNFRRLGRFLNGATKVLPPAVDRILESRLQRQAAELVGGAFSQSNSHLQELTNLPLKDLGYEVA